MRLSELFGNTVKEAPAEAQMPGHRLLIRAGFIHQVAAGIFTYLPLGRRVMDKIESILHREMQSIGGQKVTMPVVLPADIWEQSGRLDQIGLELTRLKDRRDHDMVLAMTHEEALANAAGKIIRSYKQMPALVYHIQTKWRDDPRPRAGLIRVREFTMKDSYSLDTDEAGLDKQYKAHYEAYFRIFSKCGLKVSAVASDVGMMGGKEAHEFMYFTPYGEDTILVCPECAYSANRQVADFKKEPLPAEEALPVEEVATPDCPTIASLAEFLSIPSQKTAKAVFLMAVLQDDDKQENESQEETLVTAILRGDMDLNETKLANIVGAKELRPATDQEITACGGVPGYASPRGMRDTKVVVDDLIPKSANLVAGANKQGYHLKNTNFGRDYKTNIVGEIAAARAGDLCIECGAKLQAHKAVEVGNIFKLGTRYSQSMGVMFLDQNGKQRPVVMGSYGIGVGRLAACVAEEHNDENGLIWPASIAPYHAHLILLDDKKDNRAKEAAEKLYSALEEAGVEVLFDDRAESPGSKFNDADLIGVPIRLTVGKRSLEAGGVEMKLRKDTGKGRIIPVDKILETISNTIKQLEAEIA